MLTEADLSLGERLTESGKLDRSNLLRARKLAESGRGRLPAVLSHLGLVREPDMAAALAAVADVPLISERDFPTVAVAEERLRGRFLRRARVLPVREDADTIYVAMADPLDVEARQAVQLAAAKPVQFVVAEATQIEQAIGQLYFSDQGKSEADAVAIDVDVDLSDDVEKLKGLASEAPVIRMVNSIIDDAVGMEASDIHIEPAEGALGVRFRLDGRLVERNPLASELTAAVVSRIKIMARLDIAERRLPQDGRVQAVVRGRTVDLRISTMPTILGETVVVRILDRDSVDLKFSSLGIEGENRASLEDMLGRPNGIILVTGPTGSGKTTTLYAGLSTLNSRDVNILTVEDPIEYRLSGVKQVQVMPSIGRDFARVLRSMLRHDPDVILVGEIRDRETAEIAIQAALTGHLVLSTVHTNDAVGTIIRLTDMGLESYLLTSSILGVVAQRLVRRLCPTCRAPERLDRRLAARMGFPEEYWDQTFFRAVGCNLCHQRGYRGRTSITEIMKMTPEMRELVLEQPGSARLFDLARAQGMRTLFEDGIKKVLQGTTTLEEVLRVTQDARLHGAQGRLEGT